jgi:hypothetical protein
MRAAFLGAVTLTLAGCAGQPLQSAATSSPVAATESPSPTPSPTATPTRSGPHFVEVSVSVAKTANAQNGNPWADTVVFNEVGLQIGQRIDYRLSATATANYACNSTTALDQTNQQVVTGPVVATGSFVADGTGAVMNQLTLQPPAAPKTTCPAGYQLGIWRISYVDVQTRDTTNSVVHAEPGFGGQAQ